MRVWSWFANSSVLVSSGGEQRSKLSHVCSVIPSQGLLSHDLITSQRPCLLIPQIKSSHHQDVFSYVYLLNLLNPKSIPIDFINIFSLN